MSLIDEALKRARQEAALQDAAQREAQFRRVPVYTPQPPARSRSGLLMAGAGLGAGIVLVLGLAFAAGWIPGRSDDTREPLHEELRAEAEAPVAVPQVLEETPAPADPADPTVTPAQVPAPAPAPAPTPLVVETRPVPVTPSPTPAPAPIQAEVPRVEENPAPAPAAAPPVETPAPLTTVSYVRQVPVPGGGTLELGGIAFSAERPVALINGKPWVPGEVIQGFTIVAVEPGRVQLEGHGQKVFVSLK